MNKKQTILYNVVFPIWMLLLLPGSWLIALPANLIIDYLVLRLGMKHLVVEDPKVCAGKALIKTWIFGFIADIAGSVLMLCALYADTCFPGAMSESLINGIAANPFESVPAFLWTTLCTAVSGLLIYFFNRKICLKKLDIQETHKKRLSLYLALFTAPYLFYLPSRLLYSGMF